MTRIAVAILALLAGLLTVPLLAQPAVADTGCPTPSASYPGGAGTLVSPWQISTAGDLQRLRDDSITGWDDSFILTTDINMGGCTWTKTIGNNTRAFTGLLDGGGFAVSGLTITVAETADAHAGLVGRLASPGKVTRIGFTGSVSSSATTGSNKFSHAGGLIGYAQVGSTVTYSYATGSVNAYVSLGSSSSSAYAYAGGLVGRLDGTVSDSYATGSVSATGGTGELYMYAGGLIGVSTASVSRSYSTGTPSATASPFVSLAGGFVGQTNGGTLTGNLWDVTSSGKSNGAGPGTFSGMAGKTTAQMQQFATYDDSAWPIVNGWQSFDIGQSKIWGICSGTTRAFLLWQYAASPCAAAPGAPTITGVTPSGTSASLAFTADDSGGAIITRLEFALDDTTSVDDSTTNVSSPVTLGGLSRSTDYTVYVRAVNSQGAGPWSAPALFRTLGRPGAPVITGITPGATAASVAFTADDSGGATILSIQYALDDTTGIDGSATNVSPFQLTGLTSGTAYTIYIRAVNSQGPSPWSAASTFTTLTPPPPTPPAPIPASAPTDVQATAGDASLTVAWSAPTSPGSYPVTNYQATASPGGRSCMSASTSCTIDGLRHGTSYTVTVRALSGAGWSTASVPSNAVVPRVEEVPSLTITGSRGSGTDRSMITVRGASTGLAGARVTLWLSIGERKAAPASVTAVIRDDGTFTWSRKLNRGVVIYAEADGTRSNAIRLRDVRRISLG